MRVFSIFTILLFICFGGFSQENKSDTKPSRKEKKEILKLETENRLKIIHEVIHAKNYVIKFESINSLNNETTSLTPEINFIHIDGDFVTLQLSITEMMVFTNNQIDDLNLQEKYINYSVSEYNPKQEVECRLQVITPNNSTIRIHISIMSNGFSKVTITDKMGVNFTLSGTIEYEDEKPVIPLNKAQ